jgi:tetratricopeptide (TPR) repeat protein
MVELARMPRIARHAPLRVRQAKPHLRYMAFLSYSHDDEADASWLHESLEDFRVPPRLIGQLTDMGPVPKRLTPIFRDRHELAAAADLGEEIEEAIAASRFLIVLCSKTAAQSHWINEEIALFKRLHQDERVLAVILDGEPFASDDPDRAGDECFPQALRTRFDSRGRPTTQRAEPLAADLRDSGDGRRMGLLKTIAGMLGVGLDELAQREAHRRHKRMMILTAASVAGMLFTSGLAYTAIQARDEARDQRREADKLLSFMLGDLREKLEPIGRLDVLDSVGAKALAYYESQDKSGLSDEALAQRSRALTLMGEMAFTRGDLDGALRRYREAMASTGEAAHRFPDNPQSLFDHAQNVFWVAYVDFRRGDSDKAVGGFREYRRLADRMIALAPGNADYRMERIYADTNLGTVLASQRRFGEAAEVYQQSLDRSEDLAAKFPGNLDYQRHLAEALAWLAQAREDVGQFDEAIAHRQREIGLLDRLWATNKGDTTLKKKELAARRSLARLHASQGQLDKALEDSRAASSLLEFLTKVEPANTDWLQIGAASNFERASLELAANRPGDARMWGEAACDTAQKLAARDRSVTLWRIGLNLDCQQTRARIAMRAGVPADAIRYSQQALALARTEKDAISRGFEIAYAEMLLGDALSRDGQSDAAHGAYLRAFQAWPSKVEEKPEELARQVMLFRRLGRQSDAAPLVERLKAMGYRHPDFRMQ